MLNDREVSSFAQGGVECGEQEFDDGSGVPGVVAGGEDLFLQIEAPESLIGSQSSAHPITNEDCDFVGGLNF